MKYNLSNIHPEAKIGKDVVIESFVTIEKNVEIGDGCWIGANSVIKEYTKIGKNCKVFHGAVIGAIPQDLKFRGEVSWVEIGDNTTIRECVTVNRGTAAKEKTIIGSNCLLMAYSHVAHDCILGNNVIIGNATQIAGEVEIDDFAIISAAVLIHQFVCIGSHVMIQGGSKVTKDVPPFIKAGREPIAYAGINSIGLRRRNISNEAIQNIQDIYRILYAKGLNTSQSIESIESTLPESEDRNKVVSFVKKSKRGIITGHSN
jgi:UDP-N-acetylglucosamine acyltransferase